MCVSRCLPFSQSNPHLKMITALEMEITDQEMEIIYETVNRSRSRSYSSHNEYPLLLRALSLTLENRDQIFHYKKLANSIKLLLNWSTHDLPLETDLEEKLDYIQDCANSSQFNSACAFKNFYLARNSFDLWKYKLDAKRSDIFKQDFQNSVSQAVVHVLNTESLELAATTHFNKSLKSGFFKSWLKSLKVVRILWKFDSMHNLEIKYKMFNVWRRIKESSKFILI